MQLSLAFPDPDYLLIGEDLSLSNVTVTIEDTCFSMINNLTIELT